MSSGDVFEISVQMHTPETPVELTAYIKQTEVQTVHINRSDALTAYIFKNVAFEVEL